MPHRFPLLVATIAWCIAPAAAAAVLAYPQPDDRVEPSPFYEVTVIQEGARHSAFVYCSRARTEGPGAQFVQGRTLSYTGFAATGVVEVEVRLLPDAAIEPGAVTVRPSRLKIDVTLLDPRTARFVIPRAGQYVVEFGPQGYHHGLIIAADPWETSAPRANAPGTHTVSPGSRESIALPPDPSQNVIYFLRGVHDLGGRFELPAHIREVYLEPGALVYGAIYAAHDDTTIHGRGVISGARMRHREAHLIETPATARRITVEGLFVVDFPYFAVRTLSRDSTVRWVKCIGAWIYNADGLVAWARTTLAHSFIHANDDAIKLYDSDVSVHDCVIWQMTNGAPLQLGWSSLEAHRVRVRNIDVVRAEWRGSTGANNSVINLRLPGGDGNTQSDFLFENIFVETPVARLFDLRFRDKRAPRDGQPDGGRHHLRDFVFRNIEAAMPATRLAGGGNFFQAYDREHGYENIRFENLRVNGQLVTEENYTTVGQFSIPPESKPEISFSVGP
jgi:hypothetical protein